MSPGAVAADAAAAAVLLTSLGILWRASSILTTIKLEVSYLRRDVDKMVADKDKEHSELTARITNADTRLLDHERWHGEQANNQGKKRR
jgi:3-methyladenine DNA glycosylase AlkC